MTTPAYYNTDVLLDAIKTMPKATSFLTKRYFPEAETAEFITKKVLIEFKDGNREVAPFVVPHIGGVAVDREGYKTKEFEPANIELKKILKVEELTDKGFGEALYHQEKPEVREQKLLAEDLVDLDDRITRRQEQMAGELFETSKLEMTYNMGGNKTQTNEIRFYDEGSNPNAYSIETKWNQAGADIITDLFNMCTALQEGGVNAVDVIFTPKAMKAARNNEKFIKLLDTKNYQLGFIAPDELGEGARKLGEVNADGFVLNVIMYNEKYKNAAGNLVPYITDGKVIVTAPNIGQTVYGAVTQKEYADGLTHTYAGRRVPKIVPDIQTDKTEVKLTSKPLLAPKVAHGWIVAEAVSA